MIKKADIILAAILIITGMLASYALAFEQGNGSEVEIMANGQLFGTYPLSEDRRITVEQNSHINKITIKDGSVSMSFSDCSGQDCVNHEAVSKNGEMIVCLPNRVVVEITDTQESGSGDGSDSEGYDAISR